MQEFFSVDTLRPKTIKKLIRTNAAIVSIYFLILILNSMGLLGGELQWYAYNSTYLFGLVTTVLTLFTFTSRDKFLIAISVIIFFAGMLSYIFLSHLLIPVIY